MTVLFPGSATGILPAEIHASAKFKKLDITFDKDVPPTSSDNNRSNTSRTFKLSIDLSQIRGVRRLTTTDQQIAVVVDIQMPPIVYRKAWQVRDTHNAKVPSWNESQSWLRQTSIDNDSRAGEAPTQLRRRSVIVDVARWLTYRLEFSKEHTESSSFRNLIDLLVSTNVAITDDQGLRFSFATAEGLWKWAPDSPELQVTMHNIVEILTFDVRYQFEACLSQGIFHECNIRTEFLKKLADLEPARATKLLEKALDGRRRFFEPIDVFRLLNEVSTIEKKRPSYCAKIRAAVITPTSLIISTPVVETTNRIIRKYEHIVDHFLRVKFTDERYKGKVMNNSDNNQDEIFTRVKRTLQNGIQIAGRHYDFLAFGNSQFRENGAYFFASTPDLSAADIRVAMGTFTHITTVAKYASRLGQCFSTTRGLSYRVRVDALADITRNGYTFTDGVGKVSPFIAQMVAQTFGFPNAFVDYPSVIQFRLGGYKGVLAVDPTLTGKDNMVIQTRPSQMKFPAVYHGLEICRLSQFTAAYLNQQIILVLSARGVEDKVFVVKVQQALKDLQDAMIDEDKAKDQLCKKIDYNHTTLVLAQMIDDGFMAVRDPFMMSCMRLWRSWMVKYLKEKARIFVDEGAFVLGCTDETTTLRGDFNADNHTVDLTDATPLPEIFLQIPDVAKKGSYVAVKGVCLLARNPSLHPGDIRVVRAIDVPALHHLKNCVVLPQTGDRDLANMCSGGDLDGDDFLVIWDKQLIPPEWYHSPMDYQAPEPVKAELPITVDAITSFFVTYMKHNNVGIIACAHRYTADDGFSEGVKDFKCLQLAQLHSMAVDYMKTGVPAVMPNELRVRKYPHWAERPGKSSYHSRRVLGQLYDAVQRIDLQPAWDLPFDERILSAYQLDAVLLQAASEVKVRYDEAVQRIMAQYGVENEFEIWTTFVRSHNQDENDYKFTEKLGETVTTLKQYYQETCYEKAGTSAQERDWTKIAPFIAAMYTITAKEVSSAFEESQKTVLRAGQYVPRSSSTVANMPFMSFPWIFAHELGFIA
ncbi:hypothetical protein BAUCODRAFT_67567, partial [Baudoinia panamericana UAMH 10762]